MVDKLILVDACTEDHDFSAERDREIAARRNDARFKDAITAMAGDDDPKTDAEFRSGLTMRTARRGGRSRNRRAYRITSKRKPSYSSATTIGSVL